VAGDDDVPALWQALGLPGLVDLHVHFMPENVLDKVWAYFDAAGPLTGRPWPIEYRTDEADRLSVSPYEVFRRELVIKGSFSQAYSFDRALQALRTGRVATEGIVTHTFALDDYADALGALHDRACVKAVVRP